MKYLLQDRLSDGSAIKLRHSVVKCWSSVDHHDYHPHFEVYYNALPQPQKILINSDEFRTETPTVIILSPFTIHCMTPAHRNDLFEHDSIFCKDSFFSQVNGDLLPNDCPDQFANRVFPLTDEENRYLLSIFSFLKRDLPEKEMKSAFLLFLNALFRLVPEERRIQAGKSGYYISDVLTYIYNNIASIPNSAGLPGIFHVSTSKLNRDFKNQLGLSPHQVVVNCKTAKAIDLIRNSQYKLRDIAALCGFENEYYFYVFFKNQTGQTPSSFRRNGGLR